MDKLSVPPELTRGAWSWDASRVTAALERVWRPPEVDGETGSSNAPTSPACYSQDIALFFSDVNPPNEPTSASHTLSDLQSYAFQQMLDVTSLEVTAVSRAWDEAQRRWDHQKTELECSAQHNLATIEMLEKRVETFQASIRSLNEALKHSQQDVQQKLALRQVVTKNHDVESLKKTNEDLQGTIAVLRNRVTSLDAELRAVRRQLDSYRRVDAVAREVQVAESEALADRQSALTSSWSLAERASLQELPKQLRVEVEQLKMQLREERRKSKDLAEELYRMRHGREQRKEVSGAFFLSPIPTMRNPAHQNVAKELLSVSDEAVQTEKRGEPCTSVFDHLRGRCEELEAELLDQKNKAHQLELNSMKFFDALSAQGLYYDAARGVVHPRSGCNEAYGGQAENIRKLLEQEVRVSRAIQKQWRAHLVREIQRFWTSKREKKPQRSCSENQVPRQSEAIQTSPLQQETLLRPGACESSSFSGSAANKASSHKIARVVAVDLPPNIAEPSVDLTRHSNRAQSGAVPDSAKSPKRCVSQSKAKPQRTPLPLLSSPLASSFHSSLMRRSRSLSEHLQGGKLKRSSELIPLSVESLQVSFRTPPSGYSLFSRTAKEDKLNERRAFASKENQSSNYRQPSTKPPLKMETKRREDDNNHPAPPEASSYLSRSLGFSGIGIGDRKAPWSFQISVKSSQKTSFEDLKPRRWDTSWGSSSLNSTLAPPTENLLSLSRSEASYSSLSGPTLQPQGTRSQRRNAFLRSAEHVGEVEDDNCKKLSRSVFPRNAQTGRLEAQHRALFNYRNDSNKAAPSMMAFPSSTGAQDKGRCYGSNKRSSTFSPSAEQIRATTATGLKYPGLGYSDANSTSSSDTLRAQMSKSRSTRASLATSVASYPTHSLTSQGRSDPPSPNMSLSLSSGHPAPTQMSSVSRNYMSGPLLMCQRVEPRKVVAASERGSPPLSRSNNRSQGLLSYALATLNATDMAVQGFPTSCATRAEQRR